jgi:uroporphyrinogen-III decarboxylase
MSKTPEELYQEREKRVMDAMALKKPDRVPIMPVFGFFSARYAGITMRETMYDVEKAKAVHRQVLADFAPDMAENPVLMCLVGPVLETLDCRQLAWPGHGMSTDNGYQYVEGEYMKADEYDHFLSDPSDFVVRKYWPRTCNGLRGFGLLPRLFTLNSYQAYIFGLAPFSHPDMVESLEKLAKAARQSMDLLGHVGSYTLEMQEAGFPMMSASWAVAPFDGLGDMFRGTKGLMLDMYRRPDQVIRACEMLLPLNIEGAIAAAKASGNPRVFIPIHKGIDGFMSEMQFKKFFWPTLRELMCGLIDEGLIPCPFWEGNCTSRLEIIKDIPAGKACYAFESTDIFKAKEVLGDRACIRGNVPLSILATGSPEDVKTYCKKLIDIVGKDGGYIMDVATAALDDAKPENVKTMFEFTKEYGVY